MMIKDHARLELPVGWQLTAPNEMASDVQTQGENMSAEADARSLVVKRKAFLSPSPSLGGEGQPEMYVKQIYYHCVLLLTA